MICYCSCKVLQQNIHHILLHFSCFYFQGQSSPAVLALALSLILYSICKCNTQVISETASISSSDLQSQASESLSTLLFLQTSFSTPDASHSEYPAITVDIFKFGHSSISADATPLPLLDSTLISLSDSPLATSASEVYSTSLVVPTFIAALSKILYVDTSTKTPVLTAANFVDSVAANARWSFQEETVISETTVYAASLHMSDESNAYYEALVNSISPTVVTFSHAVEFTDAKSDSALSSSGWIQQNPFHPRVTSLAGSSAASTLNDIFALASSFSVESKMFTGSVNDVMRSEHLFQSSNTREASVTIPSSSSLPTTSSLSLTTSNSSCPDGDSGCGGLEESDSGDNEQTKIIIGVVIGVSLFVAVLGKLGLYHINCTTIFSKCLAVV